ncbi:uncharacterized protein LOC114541663 [Dendronephthya gigantea]|uniref:uncharacterized protein LOC114541663 n=1 Tax=Dendronephthya gigantea TaxID=151771 RepID=UPI00106AC06F|nr:uncharacterized protein LOC114541663 [Dendronephthya gigantea]
MDAFERQDFQAAIVQNTMMYMYCCDPHYDLSFTVPSLPFFKLHGLCCHFAFHNTPSERRLCIIPNTEALLSKLNGLKSPCVINVKASTTFEFGTIPDEFIHCKAERMLLIWDFDVDRVLTENTSAVDAVTPDFDDIEETPLLNINAVSCNCSNFYPTQKVLLPPLDNTSESGSSQASQEPSESNENDFGHERTENRDIDDHHWFSDESEERDLLEHLAELENAGEENGDEQSKRNETVNEQISNEDSEEDESEEVESDEEEITHALPFKCIGAAHEQSYQHHLEQAYLALEYNESVNVRLRPEPENPRDQNAIAIDLHYGTQWENVGYIASEHCKYLHPLIAAGDILDVYVEHIKFRVNFLKIGFYPKIWIKRRGEWEGQIVRASMSVR